MDQPFSNQQLDSTALPSLQQITFQPLAINYSNAQWLISLAISLSISLTLIGLQWWQQSAWLPLNLLPQALLLLLFSGSFAIYRYACAIRSGFALRQHDIAFRRGIIKTVTTAVALSRVQHTELSQTLLERKLKIARLKLFTAGGSAADLTLYGLELVTAQQIRQQIITYSQHHQSNLGANNE